MRELLPTHKQLSTVLAVTYLLSISSVVLAAEIPNVPNAGTILRDSQQTEHKLPQRQAPNLTVEQEVKPPMANDKSFKTFVKSYRFSGQDIFSNEELTSLLAPYTNKDMDMTTLQEATNVIAKHFRTQGYFVTQAYLPAQEINNGVIEIAVIVGRCGDIILKSSSHVFDEVIMKQLSTISPGAYVHTSLMERAALLVSDLSGVAAKTTLIPGKKPGTTDIVVEAKVKGEVWQGSINENNQGSRLTGYNQNTVNFTVNNPLQQGDNVNVNVSSTYAGQKSGSIGYHIPIAEGSLLNLSYSKTYYELGKDMGYLQAYGTAYDKHADVTYNLRRSRDNNQYLQLGYDYKTMQDRMDYGTGSVTDKESHMVSVGFLGDFNDALWGGGSNSYSIEHYQGGISGSTTSGTTLTTGNWNKTTYNVMRQHYLQERLSILLSLSGQMASTNLDSSERFSLGGVNGVRAYPSDEASGDEGWLATTELRYNMPATDGALWQLTTFYDAGASDTEKNPTQQTTANHRFISGAGLGIHYIMPGNYSIKATYAWQTSSEKAQADTTFGRGHLWLSGVKYF